MTVGITVTAHLEGFLGFEICNLLFKEATLALASVRKQTILSWVMIIIFI